jgi:uncharacterized protein YndB with AHSA1/START domain
MSDTNIIVEPNKQEVVITRTFDAPKELVFKTITDPKLIPEWWGPRRLKTTVVEMDVRRGGTWRFIHEDTDGSEFGFRGVYHDITPGESVVQTFEFEGVPGHVLLSTYRLEELDGKTTLTGQSVFQSLEDRDGMVESGMEYGAREMMDRLGELLAKANVNG